MPRVTSAQEVFDAMPAHVNAEAIKGLDARIQFDLSGEGGGQWFVSIGGGQVTTAKGTTPNPSVTVTTSTADYLAMINGEMSPMNAFMLGKVKVAGDMALVMKLQSLFGRS
jgi:putative sterol carrier protein